MFLKCVHVWRLCVGAILSVIVRGATSACARLSVMKTSYCEFTAATSFRIASVFPDFFIVYPTTTFAQIADMPQRDVTLQIENIERKVEVALTRLRKVMNHQLAQPVAASKQFHAFDDKFALAEELVTLAVGSWLGIVEGLGLDGAKMLELASLARSGQRITVRVRSTEACKHVRSAKREVPSAVKVQTTSSLFGKEETTVVTTITEHFWTISHSYECIVFAGATEDGVSAGRVFSRSAQTQVVTRSEHPPIAETHSPPPSDCDLTWLLSQLTPPTNASGAPRLAISIDRCVLAPHLPAPPRISHTSPHLPTSRHISPYLPTSPNISTFQGLRSALA